MSYGLPVVTMRNTALPEILGEGGILVDEQDLGRFGEALAALAADPVRRRALGESGRQRAAALFSWETVAARYEAALQRAAAAS